LEDQIAIVAVATCHEKSRRDRRELPLSMDLTRDFLGLSPFPTDKEIMEMPAFARETAQLEG